MKKVVLASLLAVTGAAPFSFAQQPVSLGQGAQAGQTQQAGGQVQMSAEEYKDYNDANTASTPQAKVAGFEGYLKKYPNSAVKADVLQQILFASSQANDPAKALDAADRLLAVDANNFRAYVFEVQLRRQQAEALTDASAKQAGLDQAADYAKKGLAATKPKDMSDADWKNLQTAGYPVFYSAIGTAALNKKDSAAAIEAFNSELKGVPVAQTTTPGLQLQDTFYLAQAYYTSTPPDYLKCAYYAARAANFAPEPYKSTFGKLGTYCYRKFHGKDDGYDTLQAAAKDNLEPPSTLNVTPAPTPADIVADLIKSTPDLAALAISDKEYVLQNGKPEDAEKVFATIKGKTVEIPDAVVVDATESQIKAAVSEDAQQSKTADFVFNFKEPLKTVPAKDAKITLSGTYSSYTQSPLTINMDDAAVVEKKKPAPAKRPAAAAHRPAAHRK